MFFTQRLEISRAQKLLGVEEGSQFNTDDKTPKADNWYSELCSAAGIDVQAQKAQKIRSVVYCSFGSILAFTGLWIPALICVVVPLVFEYTYLQRCKQIRALHFERDYPTFLLSLASSIRTGLDTLQAISSVRDMYPEKSELGQELKTLCQKIDAGVPEVEALLQFGRTIDHPDIKLFSTAVVLSRKQGSSLGNCLQRLTRVTRHRQSFRRKSRAAIAMQRLSAFGIGGCSILIGGMQIAMNPKNFIDAWHHPLGSKMLMAGISLLLLGTLWMFQLGKRRI